MAYTRLMTSKDGRQFYKIEVSRGRGKSYLSTRWYIPDGWSQKAIDRELAKQAAEFERRVKAGEVISGKEKAEQEAAAAAEAAKLKTFRQYAEAVFMPAKEQSISENTRLSYWSNLREHAFPILGDVLMEAITPAMINALLLDFQKDHSHGSSVKLYNVIHGVFKMAYRDDTVKVDPMGKVDRPKQRKDDKAVSEADKALFEDELINILECVQNEPLKWQAFMYLASDTGARRGELCGLQWEDIDLSSGLVSIRRNLQYSKARKRIIGKDKDGKDIIDHDVLYDGVYQCSPKGGRFRTVDIGEDTIELLKKWQTEQAASRLSKWVFTIDNEDLPMFPHTPTRYFKKFGERYNIPGFHPHLLRHTSATLSLTNGADPRSIADRLGHADAAVMLNVYSHANNESIRKAGQAARDALKRKKEATITPMAAQE